MESFEARGAAHRIGSNVRPRLSEGSDHPRAACARRSRSAEHRVAHLVAECGKSDGAKSILIAAPSGFAREICRGEIVAENKRDSRSRRRGRWPGRTLFLES